MIPTHEQGKRNDQTAGRGLLIVLTLRKHVDGIWITKLVEQLKKSVPTSSSFQQIEVGIRTLEDWLAEGWVISGEIEGATNHKIIGIVNRVSDAASPALFKACCAVLAAAEQSLKIPVWNGSSAYSLCGNKWRHHLLFRQAKLSAPTTMVYYTGHNYLGGDRGIDENFGERRKAQKKTINIDTQIFRQNLSGNIDIVIKPNVGGFGAGIRKISLPLSLASSNDSNDATKPSHTRRTADISIPSSFEDEMALVQQYEIPRDGNIYRVWFLKGKVQCAVKRKVNSGEEAEEGDSKAVSVSAEFTSGCAGGNTCKFSGPLDERSAGTNSSKNSGMTVDNRPAFISSLSRSPPSLPSNLIPWKVPEKVRQEIEDQLLPLLLDAHCGSVEFLYASSRTPEAVNTTSSCNGENRDKREMSKSGLSKDSMMLSCDHQRRLYFDLNLLSTLPITKNADITQHEVSGERIQHKVFDPWLELAHGIWEFCMAPHVNTAGELV